MWVLARFYLAKLCWKFLREVTFAVGLLTLTILFLFSFFPILSRLP